MKKLKINMHYLTSQPEGQGVASATTEQIKLLKETTQDIFEIMDNDKKDGDISHFHQIDPFKYIKIKSTEAITVMHVHFLPETLVGSINMPKPIMDMFSYYFIDFYKSADYLVVVNPIFIEPLMKLGIKKERIKFIPNYVSKDDFYRLSQNKINETKAQYNIDPNKFVVLGVGQVQTRKGVLDFVEVAKQLPEVQFVWAGGFSFGAITDGYKELKDVIDNPPENVIFTDIIPRAQMNNIYNIANCLFMPSYNELFPMAILETCNLEIPMVLRDLELYKDILFHKYLKGHDNHDFIKLINQLAQDKEYYQSACELSKYISDYYSKENVSNQWIEFYQNIYLTHKETMKVYVNSEEFKDIESGKKTALIDSSLFNNHNLGKVSTNNQLKIKIGGSNSFEHINAEVIEVIHHTKTDTQEGQELLENYQEQLLISPSEIKKHASRAYFSIVTFKLLD